MLSICPTLLLFFTNIMSENRKIGQQINLILAVYLIKIIAHGRILAVYWENVAKEVQERPEKHNCRQNIFAQPA